jgi:dCMP deaminase
MIIGITGTLGAGKGTIVDCLKKRGFVHFSVRDFLIEEINKRGLVINRDSMVLVANDLRAKFGASYIVEELYKRALEKGGDSVIESIRCPGEVDALKKKDGFVLWSVDADVQTRYSRIFERASETDRVSFSEFVDNEQREFVSNDPNKQNLKRCIEMADHSFKNDWSVVELCSKVKKILDQRNGSCESEVVEKVEKRSAALSWDDYFMAIAGLSAQRSKDPSTQVGACIVDPNKKIIGVGYNGFPTGCSDDDLPWCRSGDFLDVKYPYVCHAELNAILNSGGRNLFDALIYVYLFPCNECAKAIIQSGIKEVIYLSDKYADVKEFKASRRMLEMAGVKLRQLFPETKSISVSLESESV